MVIVSPCPKRRDIGVSFNVEVGAGEVRGGEPRSCSPRLVALQKVLLYTLCSEEHATLYLAYYNRKLTLVICEDNRAERELRPTVCARKVSHGSQAEEESAGLRSVD